MRWLGVGVVALLVSCSQDLPELQDFDAPPQVSVLEPEEETTVQEGASVTFLALASDNQPSELSVRWSSDRDGLLSEDGRVDADGHTQFTTAALTPGFHAVSVAVTDLSGSTAQDSVNVRILEVADAPDLIVEHPAGDETGTEGIPFAFVITANDLQDAPSDLLVQLESSEDGYICHLPVDSTGEGRCMEILSVGTHLLTFSATDTDGFVTERTVFFDVLQNLDIDDDHDGWTLAEGDCDDGNASIYPNAPEIPYDGVDQDCVGGDLIDVDGDGHDAIQAGGLDCDDDNVLVSPSQPEVLYDGVDNDCDPLTSDDDGDGDGYAFGEDCNDADPLAWPGAVEVPYDGSDNDCDPATPDDDLDADGYPLATDCDDGNAAVHPGAGEALYDGLDNDCDPSTPDDDLDGDGYLAIDDCDDSNSAVSPGAAEVPYDGIDNDCSDGDECDVDNDGHLSVAPLCGGDDCDDNAVAITCTTYYSDIDGDGFGSDSLCLCAPTAPYTGLFGGDCYDFNADVFPGQGTFFTADRGDGSYDYNCVNGEEPLDTRVDVWDCDVDYLPIVDVVIDVDFDAGWVGGVPACGQWAQWSNNYNVTTNLFEADCDPVGGVAIQQACR